MPMRSQGYCGDGRGGEFHGQRSLVGYSPWGHKESDTTEGFTRGFHTQLDEGPETP